MFSFSRFRRLRRHRHGKNEFVCRRRLRAHPGALRRGRNPPFYGHGPAGNDCSVANQADVLGTGFCYDTQLSWPAVAGNTYFVALSQFDNFPIADINTGANMHSWAKPSTFQQIPNHHFTAESPFGPGCGQSGFCLNDGNARGSAWDVTFTGPEGLTVGVPETGSVFLTLGGLAILFGRRLQVRSRRA